MDGANLSEEDLRKNFQERQRKEKSKMLEENHRIRRRFNQKKDDPKMMEQRRSLPAWKERDKILETLRKNQVRKRFDINYLWYAKKKL